MSRFAGSGHVQNNRQYPYATMNDLVYPVHGGMEDWGYAASWDTPNVKPCTPSSNGGYPLEKTHYDDAALRAITILVETSDDKIPPESTLGGEDGVYAPSSKADGHVPRNMRLALAAIDILQPHVALSHAQNESFETDGRSSRCVSLKWEVWGAVTVDDSIALWRDSRQSAWMELPFLPPAPRQRALSHASTGTAGVTSATGLDARLPRSATSERPHRAMHAGGGLTLVEGRLVGGTGVWGGPSPFDPVSLTGCVRPPAHATTGEIALSVRADSSWAQPPRGVYAPKRAPQSHIARTRAEGGYTSLYQGFQVAATSRWTSEPIAVNCSAAIGCCAVHDAACLGRRRGR